jgi:prepilin-type N-terminal cleavage/methylation domain-containing protein
MTETQKMLDKQFHCGLRHPLPHPPPLRGRERVGGFTLVEVVVTMVIIGILAVTVMPRINFDLPGTASVAGAAYMVASDIRYAQEFAMANRVSKEIRFASGSDSYSFSPTSGLDPSGQLQGATIGTTITITFNSLGEPISIPVGTGSVTISISGIGGTRTIRIWNYTGKVDIS